MTAPDRLALCGHYVTPGTPAETMLRRADDRYQAAERASKAGDALEASDAWKEARRLVRDATTTAGYLGRAVDPGLLVVAKRLAEAGGCDVDSREGLVEAGLAAGLTEDVARRSVAEGLLRGANPRTPRVAAAPPPKPPAPPPAPRPSWSDTLTPECA